MTQSPESRRSTQAGALDTPQAPRHARHGRHARVDASLQFGNTTQDDEGSTPASHAPAGAKVQSGKHVRLSAPSATDAVVSPKHGQVRGAHTRPAQDVASVGKSAALISVLVIVSRITGFMRTWAMAFALGSTMLASSYQVANNLPNMLYELVMGGMLVTAFLPVYVSVKDRLGAQKGNLYASNLLSITIIALGVVALVCTFFAPLFVFTQSFMSDQQTMDDAVFFFRFFSIQLVFYGVSTIVSGLLNASRSYGWSSAAPIFNNLIVTVTFVAYAFVAPHDPELAKVIIAVGNPLGVFLQMAVQIPALRSCGIKITFRIDLKDPALKETLSIGVPALLVTAAGLVIVSVQTAAAYACLDNGPSIIAYARLWFTLPYAFLTVPITTALFTEIATMHARGNMTGLKHAMSSGINQILYFMVPFAMYLVVFSIPLVTLYHIGAFSTENILQIAGYLCALAVSLPFYAVSTLFQKAFSTLRKMRQFAGFVVGSGAVQIVFIMLVGSQYGLVNWGINIVALSETVYYVLLDLLCMIYLRSHLGALGISGMVKSLVSSLLLGLVGAAAGAGVLALLNATVLPYDTGSLINAFICIILGGITSVVLTYGVSIKLHIPESAFLTSLVGKVLSKVGR